VKGGGQSLAAALSFHPDPRLKQYPRFQRNNPMNLLSVQPERPVHGVLYGDGQVVKEGTNLTVSPVPQQQIMMRPPGSLPGGGNPVIPGHPDQIAKSEVLQQLGNPRLTSTAAMSATEQAAAGRRPEGDAMAAISRGIPGQIAMRPEPRGMNTRAVGQLPRRT